MAEQIARFKPGENVPGYATVDLTGGRFVKVSAAKTTQGDYPLDYATAATKPFGVLERDLSVTNYADVNAQERRGNVIRRGAIARVEAGGTIAVGAEVEVGSSGKAVTIASGVAAGRCLVAATNGTITEIDLY